MQSTMENILLGMIHLCSSSPDMIANAHRSLTNLDRQLRDKFVYPSGWRRPVGTRSDVYGEEICLIMSVRRKLYLGTINEWLARKRPLDETVMEALSEFYYKKMQKDIGLLNFASLDRLP